MAKFVLAGKADCPYFAKAERLADLLHKNLPSFTIHKIVQHPDDWEQWLQTICDTNGWKHNRSPIVWREMIDRGGKGLLLGGFSEFMEHAQIYYGITSDIKADLMMTISAENLQTKIDLMEEETYYKGLIKPLHIWITSALSPVCYNLIPLLCNGEIFGESTFISLHLLNIKGAVEELSALKMESEDLSLPLLHEVTVHADLNDAFMNAGVIIVLDEVKQEELSNTCKEYGHLIDSNAHSDVRVVVAGNSYVNLKCYLIMQSAPSIATCNFVAVATHLENIARSQLAKKLNVTTSEVKCVLMWGNIGGSIYIDLQRAKVYNYDGAVCGPPHFSQPVLEMVYDTKWLETEFLTTVNKHQRTVRKKLQHSLGISEANGICTVLHRWYHDSPPGEIMSLGVLCEGQYGIPEDLVFSMPVTFHNGIWKVVSDIKHSDDVKEKLQLIAKEMTGEKVFALKTTTFAS
ncbi:putative malate dehydrogenase 1B [Huso huso]|uniref:Malate dehydrogenase 1B n=1 Tax=Huso huso TaxID=61971 RepID=A0ABR0ZEH8_HUSHU